MVFDDVRTLSAHACIRRFSETTISDLRIIATESNLAPQQIRGKHKLWGPTLSGAESGRRHGPCPGREDDGAKKKITRPVPGNTKQARTRAHATPSRRGEAPEPRPEKPPQRSHRVPTLNSYEHTPQGGT